MAEETENNAVKMGVRRILLGLPFVHHRYLTQSRQGMAEQAGVELTRSPPSMNIKVEDEAAIMRADMPSKPARIDFFQRRRNLVLLGICGLIMLLLTILTPVLHSVFKRKAKDSAAQLEEDASSMLWSGLTSLIRA